MMNSALISFIQLLSYTANHTVSTTSPPNRFSLKYFSVLCKLSRVFKTQVNICTGMGTRRFCTPLPQIIWGQRILILSPDELFAPILLFCFFFTGLAYIGLAKGYGSFCLLQAFQTLLEATHYATPSHYSRGDKSHVALSHTKWNHRPHPTCRLCPSRPDVVCMINYQPSRGRWWAYLDMPSTEIAPENLYLFIYSSLTVWNRIMLCFKWITDKVWVPWSWLTDRLNNSQEKQDWLPGGRNYFASPQFGASLGATYGCAHNIHSYH